MNIPNKIEERNAWFKALSPSQKRIAVAQDVIDQIETEKYKAHTGQYFDISGLSDECTLQESIDLEGSSCSVCAMGAVFASRVRLGNEVEEYDPSGDDITEALEGIFEEEQLRLMEVAFEGYDAAHWFDENYGEDGEEVDEDGDTDWFINHDKFHDATTFRYGIKGDNKDVLIAIMKNVIANNGEFVLV